MQTIEQSINVTFPKETVSFLSQRARRHKMSVAKTICDIIADYMEDDYLGKLAEKRENTCTGYVSLEDAWKKVNAL